MPEYNILFKTLKGNKWKLGKVKAFKLDVKMKVHNSYRSNVLKCSSACYFITALHLQSTVTSMNPSEQFSFLVTGYVFV